MDSPVSQRHCKCCGVTSSCIGYVDFNKSCMDAEHEKPFPVANLPVPYYACPDCGFVFTDYIDSWTELYIKTKIYNDDYIKVDPPIPGRDNVPVKETPAYHKGLLIASFFESAKHDIKMLDFGSGGNPGPTGLALLESGYDVQSYDPFRGPQTKLHDKFDVILLIEVIEHIADLKNFCEYMKAKLSRDGLLWIQTLLHPYPTPPNMLNSWYIAPRNGHVSIFTFQALTQLFRPYGINIVENSVGIFGFKNLPLFHNAIFMRS